MPCGRKDNHRASRHPYFPISTVISGMYLFQMWNHLNFYRLNVGRDFKHDTFYVILFIETNCIVFDGDLYLNLKMICFHASACY